MSAHLQFISRLDKAGGRAVAFDDSMLDDVRNDGAGKFIGFRDGGLGLEIGRNSEAAMSRLMPDLRKRWPDAPLEKVQDAAKAIIRRNIAPLVDPRFDGVTNFTSNDLELQGGPGENVSRPPAPTLFVPGPGRVMALQSRNVLKPGYRTNSFKIREHHGQASFVENNAWRELQNADYSDEKEIRGAAYYGSKYSWSVPDSWEAAIVGDDLQGERQFSAIKAVDDFRERVSWWGSTDKNIEGFATISGALLMLAGQQFSSMTPTAVQMLQRLAAMEARYMLGNQGARPTHCVMPHADRLSMQNTYFGAGGEGPSVWDRAVAQYAWIKNAMFHDNLTTGNYASSATRWVIYTEDKMNLYIEHMESMVFGPFDDYGTQTFIIIRRHGGAVAKLPEQVLYVDFTV
jgi:hypothetical protein